MDTRVEKIRKDLESYGIAGTKEIHYNLSYEDLFKHETDPTLVGFERGELTDTGAINVDTGKFTGRSPKDKFIVMDYTSRDTVWWSTQGVNDNRPLKPELWDYLKGIVAKHLSGKSFMWLTHTVVLILKHV